MLTNDKIAMKQFTKMINFVKKRHFLIIIIFIASFFYCFRLQQTFVMAGDTSRDLIDVMRIWQNKEITVIGEPVNTISNNPIQVFFGSLHLYFGLLGLLLSNFNPAGSVLVNIVLTLTSIPFFYLLSKKLLKKESLARFSTVIYALSPITVALARSYWEPNTIIPISVFVWFLFLYKKSLIRMFLAGIVSGIIFDVHYMNAIPIIFFIFLLIFQKNKKYFLMAVVGFLLAISPFIAFELKNNFFLIRAFLGTFGGFSTFSERTLNPFLSMDVFSYIFGLGPKEYFIPALFDWPFLSRIIIDTLVGIPFLYFLLKKRKELDSNIVGVILVGLLVGWYFEKWHLLALRYILSVFPLFVISFVYFFSSISQAFLLVLIIPMLILSTKTVTHKLDPNSKDDYYPLSTVEEISRAIVVDNPTGKYNVTENILGDARSLAFRFYLLKDAKVKPQPVEIYDKLDTLYVITPSLDRTYKEDRWEFSASGPKTIVWEKDFGDLKLFKFTK